MVKIIWLLTRPNTCILLKVTGYFNIHFTQLLKVKYYHPFHMLKLSCILRLFFGKDIEQNNPIIWIHQGKINQGEYKIFIVSTSQFF